MTHNYPAMIADPNTHGFEWLSEEVRKDLDGDRQYVKVGNAVPILKVIDIALFEATFPGVVLASLDGTVHRRQVQDVGVHLLDAGVLDRESVAAGPDQGPDLVSPAPQ